MGWLSTSHLPIFIRGNHPSFLAPYEERHWEQKKYEAEHGAEHLLVLQPRPVDPGSECEEDNHGKDVAREHNTDKGVPDNLVRKPRLFGVYPNVSETK